MGKFNPILGPIRGSLGATVFSHNAGGDYVKLRQAPTNPNSARQQAVRSILSVLSAAFVGLTEAERGTWQAYADLRPRQDPLGQSYTLTGHQQYIAINSRLQDAGLTLLDEAPINLVTTELVGPTVTISSATAISLAFTGTAPGGSVIVAWMSQPFAGARDPNFNQATLIGYTAADPVTPVVMTLPIPISSGLSANFWVTFMDDEGQQGVVEKDVSLAAY
jgi:hypothetical protein